MIRGTGEEIDDRRLGNRDYERMVRNWEQGNSKE